MRRFRTNAFTIVELLVVLAIITTLIGILLPAINRAREGARQTMSKTNLRNLATAHDSYSAMWNDRQFTLIDDGIAQHGDNILECFSTFRELRGGVPAGQRALHPAPRLGWGYANGNGPYVLFSYRCDGNLSNQALTVPINFEAPLVGFGSFRLINVGQFNQYVSGRFYDRVFYAPNDEIVVSSIESDGAAGQNCFDDPGEYCDRPAQPGFGDAPAWSSYVMSPAAMFNPMVLSRKGYTNPWSLSGGMRSPSRSQATYASLKTMMIEHHWLQRAPHPCNPGFVGGAYGGCEPYYFNHGRRSAPAALFYDGHVENVDMGTFERDDARAREQTGVGLWSRDTPFGSLGYYGELAYDDVETSAHIFTTDGIRGRDVTDRD